MSRKIPLDNDFEFEYTLTRKNTNTGVDEAATGLTSLTGLISASDAGATIHADLSVSATERSGKSGTYYGVFDGDKLRTHLASLIGTKVYVVFGDGTNVFVSDEYVVEEPRRSATT
jgi:hypothetical protein